MKYKVRSTTMTSYSSLKFMNVKSTADVWKWLQEIFHDISKSFQQNFLEK